MAVPTGLYALVVFTGGYPMPAGPVVIVALSWAVTYAAAWFFLPVRL